ncbi:MFS transporter [Aeromicrobium phragmitis]|uniref:MFS transporter n=2 Tax=Aeromicrobium phragmitis TaxID=2478914 RepID=A0A3L8PIC3_9ACTN|nr:MFS transporter [Aeromicrobium phragmitis]
MLVIGMLGQLAGTLVVSTPPFLIPHLHLREDVSLVSAGALAAAPTVGTMLSLVAWGAVVDRFGERLAMAAGLALVTIGAAGAFTSDSLGVLGAWFFLCGVGAASTNAASGRLVVGWFPARRRGFAMGIRQTALPLGVGAAALLVPNVVDAAGLRPAILTVAVVAAVATLVSLAIVDPPRPERPAPTPGTRRDNPYRGHGTLARIHLASALLVIPQYAIWTFLLLWLIDAHHWSTTAASALVAVTHLLSAAGRIGVGWWSDRLGSRLRPMRWVAIAAAAIMLGLGLLQGSMIGIALAVAATVVTVADNGLAFTAVAERAGPFWSGRAFGFQNTGQYLTAAAVPPLVGAVVTSAGYGWAFGGVAIAAALAVFVIPDDADPLQ